MELNREKTKTIVYIVGLLFGLLVFPPLVQRFYGINAIPVAFLVVVIYALLNYRMKKNRDEKKNI